MSTDKLDGTETKIPEIIIELKQGYGEEDVALNLSDLADKSKIALDNALDTIQGMAIKVIQTIKKIPVVDGPEKIEVEFGLKLSSDATAVVVSTGIEAQINVKLCWERSKDKK